MVPVSFEGYRMECFEGRTSFLLWNSLIARKVGRSYN